MVLERIERWGIVAVFIVLGIYATSPRITNAMEWGLFPGVSSLATLESQLGKTADIQAIFSGWPDNFPTYVGNVCATNPKKALLVFWENYNHSLDNIIAGQYDTYIRSYATQTANYKCTVMISLFHEMNGNWDDWDGTVGNNSPAKIIAAWKHIVDIFRASNVTNVKWAWAVNNGSVPNQVGNQFNDYYPGSAYVDYVGVDGFNDNNPWQTFGQVFDAAIAKLQTYNKPIYIFSMASAAGSGKAAWITEGLGSHVYSYANVRGWVWFNLNGRQNWLIDSDAQSLAAFKAILPTATTPTPPPPAPSDTIAPLVPSNLSASAISTSQINLSWSASTDNVGIIGYRIYRGGTLLTSVTGTSYSNSGLTARTTYSYTVAAYDAAGNESAKSASASAKTLGPIVIDTTAPSVPTGLSVSVVSTSQINLSWSASTDPSNSSGQASGVAGYKVYRNGTQVTTITSTTYSSTGLAAGTAYSYTVAANDALRRCICTP